MRTETLDRRLIQGFLSQREVKELQDLLRFRHETRKIDSIDMQLQSLVNEAQDRDLAFRRAMR